MEVGEAQIERIGEIRLMVSEFFKDDEKNSNKSNRLSRISSIGSDEFRFVTGNSTSKND